jgi:hypothetical protein
MHEWQGRSVEMQSRSLGAHTPAKTPRPISRTQAYIAYLLKGVLGRFTDLASERSTCGVSPYFLETVVL